MLFATWLMAVLALASCTERKDRPVGDTAPTPASSTPVEQPAPADTPHVVVPDSSAAPHATGPMPAPGAIGFAGFGPAKWGANEEQVRMAWGKDMQSDTVDDPAACHYLFPLPRPSTGVGTAFMFEGGKLVRIDVDSAHIPAPGGGKVGMTAEAVRALYPGRTEVRPHKYVEGGQYLRITGPGSAGVLVFDVTDATVNSWRIGVAPQVDYVEGCG
jgi:hypothetical protein